MNVQQAEAVRAGDTVIYQKARRRVVTVSRDGLWAPYFELAEDGRISHVLVEPAEAQQARSEA